MLLTFLFALGFAIIHWLSKYMTFLENVPRSRLLSVAGGISVAYVFLHLLPELSQYHRETESVREKGEALMMESEIYLCAMAGLAIFYGLQRMVSQSARKHPGEGVNSAVFWLHMASFALYNALIGYLLIRGEEKGLRDLLFYFVAMAVHFISNDHGLRQAHEEIYDRKGRWVLSTAVIGGWIFGVLTELDKSVVSFLFAFLAGGVILNVMKEELPEERESNFWAFLLGLACRLFYLIVSINIVKGKISV